VHVTKSAYFEYQRPGDPGNRYYINTPSKNHIPVKFVQANRPISGYNSVGKTIPGKQTKEGLSEQAIA